MSALPSTSNDNFCPAPNRQYFEREIWRVNNCLSKVHNEMKQFWSEDRKTEINKLKGELSELKAQFYASREEDGKLSDCLQKLQNQHQQKIREMHELEDNDLVYKDLTFARQKLLQVEESYNKRNFSSMREEQLQVNELNRIRRNVQKLAKYVLLVDQRKQLESDIKADRQKIRELRQKMRSIRDKMQHCRKQITDTHQTFCKMKEIVTELKTEKRNLIEKYDDERQAYDDWLKCNKAKMPSSHPAGNASSDIAMEPLQLFHVQKTNCKRLIDYIQRLLASASMSDGNCIASQSEASDNNSSKTGSAAAGPSTDSDSADELPSSFKHFAAIRNNNADAAVNWVTPTNSSYESSSNNSSQNSNSCVSSGCGSKFNKRVFKQLKKASKRQGMPLSHGIDYIKLFNDIDVSPPKMISDAETALSEVRAVLRFYEEQTALTSHDELTGLWEDGIDGGYSPILSVTGSTFTSPRSLSSCSLALKADDDNQSA